MNGCLSMTAEVPGQQLRAEPANLVPCRWAPAVPHRSTTAINANRCAASADRQPVRTGQSTVNP